MTDTQGAVYDLGYVPYDGERLGRSGARRAVFWDGIRRVLGIRRKARRKVLPWALIVIAVIPAIVVVGIGFFVPGEVTDAVGVAQSHANFFVLGGTIAMIFTALSAPELLVPDRREGVLSILSSRPLTSTDYLAARLASLVAIVASFLLLPQVVLYVGLAGTNADGLFRGLIEDASDLPKILIVTAIYVIAFVPLGFVVASLSNRKAVATIVYIALMIGLTSFAEAIVQNNVFTGGRWTALLAPINTSDAANNFVFGTENPESLLAAADIHPWYGIIALAVFGIFGIAFSVHRYRSLM